MTVFAVAKLLDLFCCDIILCHFISNKTSPFLTCFPYRRSPSAYFEGIHGVRFAWGNTQHSHRNVSFSCYITRSRAKIIHTRPFTCTIRQVRRSLSRRRCGSRSVFTKFA